MATTLCATCGEHVEHALHWTISVERDAKAGESGTRLIANRTLVIQVCTQIDAQDNPTAD